MKLFYDLTLLPYLLVALGCVAIVALFAVALVTASIRRGRATATFGDPALVSKLESFDASGRRALKGVLLVVALVAAFLALARPQWGRGTKLVPATNLDVVVVLDQATEEGLCPPVTATPDTKTPRVKPAPTKTLPPTDTSGGLLGGGGAPAIVAVVSLLAGGSSLVAAMLVRRRATVRLSSRSGATIRRRRPGGR